MPLKLLSELTKPVMIPGAPPELYENLRKWLIDEIESGREAAADLSDKIPAKYKKINSTTGYHTTVVYIADLAFLADKQTKKIELFNKTKAISYTNDLDLMKRWSGMRNNYNIAKKCQVTFKKTLNLSDVIINIGTLAGIGEIEGLLLKEIIMKRTTYLSEFSLGDIVLIESDDNVKEILKNLVKDLKASGHKKASDFY